MAGEVQQYEKGGERKQQSKLKPLGQNAKNNDPPNYKIVK